MPAVALEPMAPPALDERVALVRAQLEPIRSRLALIESYRRESLCRLATTEFSAGSAAEVLELAYAVRWLELAPDVVGEQPTDCSPAEVMDE